MVEEFKCQGAPDKTARSVNLPAWGSGPVSSSVFKDSVDVGLMSGTAAGQFYRPITLVVRGAFVLDGSGATQVGFLGTTN